MQGGDSQVMGQCVDLSRGSVTLMNGKSLEDAEQSNAVTRRLFSWDPSGLCVENGLQGKWTGLGAAFQGLFQPRRKMMVWTREMAMGLVTLG